ncbi:putative phytol kinase 1 [Nymphaea thermarum]|nr:putative phytol kinase 1 [Nymphaea thermarum]
MRVMGEPFSCLILIPSGLVIQGASLIPASVKIPWRGSLFSGGHFRQRASQRHRVRTPGAISPRFSLGGFGVSLDSVVVRDTAATSLVLAGAYSLVRCFDSLAEKGLIEQKLSRKLVHILSGLMFMTSWPLFSSSTEARFFASVVPLANMLRLLFYGLSLAKDESLVKSVTREGKPEELLRGPLYYVLVLMCSALFFWRKSPVGVVSLTMMCAGDGVADIMGRRFGTQKLPYNEQKSWVGSISMFLFGSLSSLGMLFYFHSLGYFPLNWQNTASNVALISLIATIVESLPIAKAIDDNISVPLISMLLAMLLFEHQPH